MNPKTKRWLAIAGAAVLAMVAAIAAVPLFLDANSLLAQVKTQVEPRIRRQVTLGGGELSAFPPRVLVKSFAIGEDPALGAARPFASAEVLEVRLGLLALLTGDVDITSITLRKPVIELIRKPDGTWNYESMGSGEGATGPNDGPSIQRLQVEDGTVAVSNTGGESKRTVYEHIDLLLTDYAPGKRFSLETSARLQGAKDSTVAWKGSGTGIADVEGKISFRNAAVGAIEKFLNREPMGLDADLSGGFDVTAKGDSIALKGAVETPAVKYKGRAANQPARVELDVAVDSKSKMARIARAEAKFGAAVFGAAGDVAYGGNESTAKLRLTSKQSPLVDLRKLVALAGANPGYETKGVLTADVAAEGPVSKLAFSGSAAIRGLEVKSKEWKTAVRSPGVEFALTPKSLSAAPFTVEAGGTRLTGAFQVDDYLDAGRLNAELRAAGADLAELIHMAQAFGVSSEGVSGEGNVSVDLKVRGPLKNANALDLSGTAALNGVTLRVPALAKPLQVAKANVTFRENSAAMENASASVGGLNLAGRVAVRNFSAPQVEFALESDRINPDELKGLTAEAKSEAAGGGAKVTASGTLKIGTLVLSNLTLTQVSGRCTYRDGRLAVNPMSASLYGGSMEGAISAETAAAQAMPLTLDVRMARVDANKLLSAATPARQMIFGTLGANTKLRLRAGDPDALVKSLNGTLELKLENGKIAGVNLLNEIAKVAKFMGYAKQDTAFTNVVLMSGTLAVKDGVAATDNLLMELDGAKVGAAGTIDLTAQKLDLRMTSTISKELSERVGGTQVGGFMVTAMANEARQLVVPVFVRGPMSGPKVTPDAERITQMNIKKMTPPKMAEAIKESEEKLKGVLDIFKKKKKPEAEKQPGKQP